MSVAVCITTYNEADTIGVLVRRLLGYGYSVVVSDGGSTDNTALEASRAGAVVIRSQERRPIAPCLLDAFRFALSTPAKRIAVMDAGDSHNLHELPRLLTHDTDVVIGSRFVKGATYEGRAWRAALSRIAAVACNWAQHGAHWRDWTSGYRVYSRRAIEEILKHVYVSAMHGWQIETLARLGAAGLSIVEAPISYRAGRTSFDQHVAGEAFRVWLHTVNHISWRAK